MGDRNFDIWNFLGFGFKLKQRKYLNIDIDGNILKMNCQCQIEASLFSIYP